MTILAKILTTKCEEVKVAEGQISLSELRRRCNQLAPAREFAAALTSARGIAVIAEIKRGSPSAGEIRMDLSPEDVAQKYQANGAAAISVLTDEMYFRGHLSFLQAVRSSCQLPLLRKDFVISPYQIWQARAFGADAVLLIAAAMPPSQLQEFVAIAAEARLATLVEVHDETELAAAIAAKSKVIGVNHRNLHDFSIDLTLTERLAPLVPPGTLLVAESGIRTGEDLRRLQAAGAHAVLVGESLMRQESPGAALRNLLGDM